MAAKKGTPSWSDLKAKLADLDRAGLIGLVQDLYAASNDNQVFLHARFGLGDDVLKPYKATIDRWIWPDVYRESGHVSRQGEEGDLGLQKGHRSTRGSGGADGVLLRAGWRIQQRVWRGGRGVLRCAGSDVRAGTEDHCTLPDAARPCWTAWTRCAMSATTWAMVSARTWMPCCPSTGSMSDRIWRRCRRKTPV